MLRLKYFNINRESGFKQISGLKQRKNIMIWLQMEISELLTYQMNLKNTIKIQEHGSAGIIF